MGDLVLAKRWLLDELLGDFPFVSDADRANALSVLFTPFVRNVIQGPTPLHWVGAPEPGTGKGKLVDCLLAPACGVVASYSFPDNESERRKAVTSKLREGAPAIKWDNVKGTVKSAVLEQALTEARWTDRLLGVNASIDVPVTQLWTLTANNATPGTDLKRRCVPIRLDAKVEEPARRTGPGPGVQWRHSLPGWALENRRHLVWASLVIVQWWVQQGSPLGQPGRIGSYESWDSVIGGLLQTAGVSGFLDNLSDLDTGEDPERDELAEFLSAWSVAYGDQELTALELVEDGQLRGHVEPHVSQWNQNSVGAYLRARRDRIAAGLKLIQVPRRGQANTWRIEKVDP